MQLQRGQKLRLATFFLAASAILAASVVAVVGGRWMQPVHTFTARFHENVSGLERNAAVRYQGLRVGRVEKLYVAPDDPTEIEVVLAIDPHTTLYAGTQAQLDLSGITGLKNLNLLPGDARHGAIAPGSRLPTAPSLMGRLADNASEILGDVRQVAQQLGEFASPTNRRQIEHLIVGLDRVVTRIDGFLLGENESIRGALHEGRALTHAIREAADETKLTVRRARQLIDNVEGELQATLQTVRGALTGVKGTQVAATLDAVEGAAGELRARLGQAETGAAIASFNQTLHRVDHLVRDVDLAVRAGRDDFGKTLSYLRQAAEDLREFSRILASNPSVLVRGRGEGQE